MAVDLNTDASMAAATRRRSVARARRPSRRAALLLMSGLLLSGPALAGISVDIDGISGALRDNVKLRLSIANQAKRTDLDQSLVEALNRDARDEIGEALQPFGYYNPEIQTSLSGHAPDWTARYVVYPGPQTRIDSVSLEIDGAGKADFEGLRQTILSRLKPGEPLLHGNYEQAKNELAGVAYAAGYLDARFTRAELRVYADDNRAEIALSFDTGPQYHFGAVTVDQDILDPDVIDRYVTIDEGAVYDPQQLLNTQFALGDLGYFEQLDVLPQREDAQDAVVPIVIRTTPRKKYRYNFGIGYGTDTGVRGTAGIEIRHLNHRGHSFKAQTRQSEVKDSWRGDYRIPVGSRPGESIGLAGEYSQERYVDGRSRKWGVEASLTRIPGHWQRRYYLAYAHEDSELGTAVQTSDLLMPGLSLNRSQLDDPVYARRGWSAFLDLHGAGREVIANVSFFRAHTVLRGVLPLGKDSRLLARYEYGAAIAETFAELPASQRFFAGGDQSVRGYRYQSLGPRASDGTVVGGRYVNTMSVEAERRIWHNWGAAAFFDAGGADDTPTIRLYEGAGVGLRYRAPVGSLQIDFAHPLQNPDGGSGQGIRLHLGVRVGL